MKAVRTFLGIVLILLIIGGIGYIAWSLNLIPGLPNLSGSNPPSGTTQPRNNGTMNMPQGTMNMPQGSMNMSNSSMATGNSLNNLALQNKDRLNQIITTITDAINEITIDPYSNVIIPGGTSTNMQTQPNGTINIYPSGNNSVNITPSGGVSQNNQLPAANTNQGGTARQSVVYDQAKLEQLHTGIFRLSQGMMMLSQLNDDLTVQAGTAETTPPDYQTYIKRYNVIFQNKIKLNNAINLINSAVTLINVNPYASPNGYQYNTQGMERLHRGIYKLAQGMVLAAKLSDDLTNQLMQVQNSLSSMNTMSGMNMYNTSYNFRSFINNLNLPFIFNIILIIMIIGLITGIFGAISQAFKSKGKMQ